MRERIFIDLDIKRGQVATPATPATPKQAVTSHPRGAIMLTKRGQIKAEDYQSACCVSRAR